MELSFSPCYTSTRNRLLLVSHLVRKTLEGFSMKKAEMIAIPQVSSMVVVAAVTAMLSCCITQTAFAHTAPHMTPFSSYRYNVPNATIQLSDSKTKSIWHAAINKWNGTHAFTFKIVKSGAQVHADSFSSMSKTYSTTTGITYSKICGSQLLSAHVRLNNASLGKYKYTTAQRTNVAEHELGHAMGLLHNPNAKSVMYYKNRYVSIQPVDVSAIQKDYRFLEFSDTFGSSPVQEHTFYDPVTPKKATIQADSLNVLTHSTTHIDFTKVNPG